MAGPFRLVEDPLGPDAVSPHAAEDLAELLRLFNESCGTPPPDYDGATLRRFALGRAAGEAR